jgi:endonuclease/exonuclease/phosphatase family metal-dependent hydrolase
MENVLNFNKSFSAKRLLAALFAALAWSSVAGAQATQDIRVVSYNTQGDVSSPTPSGVIPYLATVLEGIGQQKYVGDNLQLLPDVIGLQETTSNSVSVAPLVNALNTYYNASIYNYSSYQATQSGGNTSGNGPNALIYNQQVLSVVASVGVGNPAGSGNGEYRQVARYEMQPIANTGTSNGIFYVYVCHAKSLSSGSQSTDQTYQQEEAAIIRNDEATLPSNSSVIYLGDWNINASTDPSMVTMTASGQGQAIDALNPTNSSENWAKNSAYTSLLTDSDAVLQYRDDIQFMTSNVYGDATGALDYIAGSAHAFGNNGSIAEGGNINSTSNTALNDMIGALSASEVLSAMNGSLGSDHLPVVADYQVTVVPEPGSASILILASAMLLRRRHRVCPE